MRWAVSYVTIDDLYSLFHSANKRNRSKWFEGGESDNLFASSQHYDNSFAFD